MYVFDISRDDTLRIEKAQFQVVIVRHLKAENEIIRATKYHETCNNRRLMRCYRFVENVQIEKFDL